LPRRETVCSDRLTRLGRSRTTTRRSPCWIRPDEEERPAKSGRSGFSAVGNRRGGESHCSRCWWRQGSIGTKKLGSHLAARGARTILRSSVRPSDQQSPQRGMRACPFPRPVFEGRAVLIGGGGGGGGRGSEEVRAAELAKGHAVRPRKRLHAAHLFFVSSDTAGSHCFWLSCSSLSLSLSSRCSV